MSWTRGYLSGSFRGVPFRTERTSHMGGRRLVEHVFPQRDDAYFEDLGRVNPRFQMNLYVIGDDYFKSRDNLIKALDADGSGQLVHPYRGVLLVKVDSWDVVEEVDNGRMARISVTFVLDKELFLTVVGSDVFSVLQAAKGDFFSAVLKALAKVYEYASYPTNVLQDIVNTGNKILDVVEAAKKITGVYEEYQGRIDALRGQMGELVLDIEVFGRQLIGAIDFGTDPFDPLVSAVAGDDFARDQFAEMHQIVDLQTEVLTSFPALAAEKDYYPGTEIQKLAVRTAIGSGSGLVGAMTINSTSEASEILATVGQQVESIESDPTVDDEVFTAAQDLRKAVAEVLRVRKLTLDQLVVDTTVEFEPSLVTAWRLYKSLGRENDVIQYNYNIHPGFIKAGDLLVPRG